MEESEITNSLETIINSSNRNEELCEIHLETGINVWSTDQQILENQALEEIKIFTDTQNCVDVQKVDKNIKKDLSNLNIEKYIKQQEELKKVYEYKKTLQVSEKSRAAAAKINQRGKRKRSDSSEKLSKTIETKETEYSHESGSEYVPSGEDSDYNLEENLVVKKRKRSHSFESLRGTVKDDGCMEYYKTRLEEYYKQLEAENLLKCQEADSTESDEIVDYYTIKKGLKIPLRIWSNLYSYQQDGVRWLWSLHRQITGGILGDEMGLGKTVQIIAFLAGLEYSQVISMHGRCKGLGPTLIVCPATVIHQWVQHFHEWAPEFRVVVLHQSGSYVGNKGKLIKEIIKNKGIIVTTYQGILKYESELLEYDWHYLILDEGHKIRNSNAKTTIGIKKIRTPHRLLLTGSPMQNNLQELWSLFDFTNPGILGEINTFIEHFVQPIIQGGFVNATPMQEATALSMATALKDLISPYLLRRCKAEVQDHIKLPDKSEQVLFCSLTDYQKDLYKGYLMSDQVNYILGKDSKNWFSSNQVRANVLIAITNLRKICNHPDLYLTNAIECPSDNEDNDSPEKSFGYYKHSGKMIVVSALLKIWKKQKHRVLLFTQSRGMITVFKSFLTQQGYKYLKMDGSTAVSSRQSLINKFNEDNSYDVFLLTTRVGGLGVNLTGANRIIIFDPDWNPATDTQARERAWRIGQDKQVTIYRLLSAGTIEEKMYQRQVWKQLLSNKVLIDPKTQRFFNSSNLHDLFSLPDEQQKSNPETTNIFRDSRVRMQEKLKEKHEKAKEKSEKENEQFKFSEDKIQAMKNLAQQIAKSIRPTKDFVTKTSDQIELEKERERKKQEKEQLKKLTPVELMLLNRKKAETEKPVVESNKVDDCETAVSFSKALEYSQETAKWFHHKVKKHKDHKKDKKHKEMFKSIIDTSGTIDGETVEGLVKTEKKKLRKKYEKKQETPENQDQFILEKLFSKKGVSGALHHDSVVDSTNKNHGIRVNIEAQMRADLALKALRKSRLNNWRW